MKNKKFSAHLDRKGMSLSGYWEFPGGKVEETENPAEALKREIYEELQCEIEVHGSVEDTLYGYDHMIVRLKTYLASIIQGSPTITEHEELAWVHYEKLHTLRWAPADIPAVEKVVSLCKREFMNN